MGRLHFFPGPRLMIWEVDGKAADRVEAWGGIQPEPGVKYEVMKPRPTTAGRYIIHSCGPYVTRTWEKSRIAWGTPLRVAFDKNGHKEVLYRDGSSVYRWRPVTDVIKNATFNVLADDFFQLYGDSKKYDSDGDGIPDIWVFNDFGPIAVRYFSDRNQNRKLDAGERLSGEMIHTTPENEAQFALGRPAELGPSHGCIHIGPLARDRLRAVKAFQAGTELIIHSYGEGLQSTFR